MYLRIGNPDWAETYIYSFDLLVHRESELY